MDMDQYEEKPETKDCIWCGTPLNGAQAVTVGRDLEMAITITKAQMCREVARRYAAFAEVCMHGLEIPWFEECDHWIAKAEAFETEIAERAQ